MMLNRSSQFRELMMRRRSVRDFSPEPVPREVVVDCIRTAASAPSGANKQPWRFVLIGDPDIKAQIRIAAEREERLNYEGGRIPPHWREDIAPLGTDWHKPYLEIAPWLIVLFAVHHKRHYYTAESVGIAAGMLICALHNAGLATLTHTPSPMRFLQQLLKRPANEKPMVLMPVGFPAADAMVPDIGRKPLDEILIEF